MTAPRAKMPWKSHRTGSHPIHIPSWIKSINYQRELRKETSEILKLQNNKHARSPCTPVGFQSVTFPAQVTGAFSCNVHWKDAIRYSLHRGSASVAMTKGRFLVFSCMVTSSSGGHPSPSWPGRSASSSASLRLDCPCSTALGGLPSLHWKKNPIYHQLALGRDLDLLPASTYYQLALEGEPGLA